MSSLGLGEHLPQGAWRQRSLKAQPAQVRKSQADDKAFVILIP